MKLPRPLHRWSTVPREAIAIQKRLAPAIRGTRLRRNVRRVAGVDAAFSRDGAYCIAGVVLWDVKRREVIEQHTARRELTFPYVPGLLSFREAPALLRALRSLRETPEVILCDGHGIAHPRRFGIACHLGLFVDLPSVGCAKSRLVGEHDEPGEFRGCRAPLTHRGETLGAVLRTRDHVRPVYVSIGHRVDLDGAERLVLECATGYRLPEPTRLADRLVAAARKSTSPR